MTSFSKSIPTTRLKHNASSQEKHNALKRILCQHRKPPLAYQEQHDCFILLRTICLTTHLALFYAQRVEKLPPIGFLSVRRGAKIETRDAIQGRRTHHICNRFRQYNRLLPNSVQSQYTNRHNVSIKRFIISISFLFFIRCFLFHILYRTQYRLFFKERLFFIVKSSKIENIIFMRTLIFYYKFL